MKSELRLEGAMTPEHVAEKYVYLPFDMPAGARRLDVALERSQQVAGAETVDRSLTLAVFDARGNEFLTGGFRGRADGKREFFIAPDAATPSFLRGPLQPGPWSLMVQCPPDLKEGALHYDFKLTLDVDAEGAPETADEMPNPGRDLGLAVAGGANGGEGRWYKGDLHAHSEHSDGKNPVDQVVDYARRAGLDYFALTDHNTISHWEDLVRLSNGTMLLIGGEEVTMPGGHANVWGLEDWVEFRTNSSEDVQRVIDNARARGSMFSINHADSPIPWRHNDVVGWQAIEVWNSPWRWYNEPTLVRWQYHLNLGRRIVVVGGSDSHWVPPADATQPNLPGEPCTWVYVEGPLTQRSVLDAVERGRVFVSEAPTGPFIELRADGDGDGVFETLPGDVISPRPSEPVRFHVRYRGPEGVHLRLFNRKGIVKDITAPSEEHDEELELPCQGRDYLRVEVRGYRGRPDRGEVVHALTNPIYWGRWR
ncbi:MAG: CehA/McbA family metallohydrolase [Dehalococcoidia bacterium]